MFSRFRQQRYAEIPSSGLSFREIILSFRAVGMQKGKKIPENHRYSGIYAENMRFIRISLDFSDWRDIVSESSRNTS